MDTHKKNVLAALQEYRGNVTKACEKWSMPRSTFYLWMNSDPEFKSEVEDISEASIDFVEDKLMQRIEGISAVKHTKDDDVVYEIPPDVTAIIFYLKTKGKKRGYVEKQEVEHQGGIILNFDKDDAKL